MASYTNAGTAPLTLDLAVEAFGKAGEPAAQGMFTVSPPRRLTVPAGGRATAAVTADSSRGSADGAFGGTLTATTADGATTARTALGVDREIESYDLTIKHVDLKGKAADAALTDVFGLDNDILQTAADETDGEVTVRLPKGRYSLQGRLPGASGAMSILLHPKFALNRNTTLVLDFRKATPVKITVPNGKAKPTAGMLSMRVDVNKQYGSAFDAPSLAHFRVGQLGVPLPADEASMMYHGIWTDKAVNYRPAWHRTGDLAGFTQTLRQKDLVTIDIAVGHPPRAGRRPSGRRRSCRAQGSSTPTRPTGTCP
ncbi:MULTISPECIES: hypothetical protein [unclassified Streptomyces]|uniref:hypothetical protein n=1 Tax=unclassified Streptomyces TaxID=2593676 RepID=UPI000823EFA3|nr:MULTISPECIES: hypothetical protein [unclassified Streptomyces]MYU02224.1 hypothetical protein [Streptomyces sp. SID8350]SCK63445.1 hypothetical protein YUWDRAFT_06962 [Streptomyces sp. AmelKG-D3]